MKKRNVLHSKARHAFTTWQRFIRLILPVVFIVGLVAGIMVLITMKEPGSVQASWFDPGWGFRTRYPLTNSSGSNQTDFQLQFTIDTATLITAGQLRSDCGDMRFVEQSGKLSGYWLEPGTCNTSTTKVWVKVTSIPTTGSNIWFYYGNPSAASQSNTVTTFIREIPNLVGAWNMDESSWTNDCSTNSVLDTSGNSNHGKACPNTTGPTGNATGLFSKAGSFDGSDDSVDVGANRSTLQPSSQVTISAWIKTSFPSQNGTIAGLWQTGAGTDNAYALLIGQDGANNKIDFAIEQSDNTLKIIYPQNNSSLTSGTWAHVVGVADGSYLRMYLNGVDTGTTTPYNGTLKTNSTGHFYIGRLGAGVYLYNGLIDDVRVYNRGLSAQEVNDLYGAGGNNQGYTTTNYPGKELVRKYNTSVTVGSAATAEVGTGPVGWWKLDEGTGTSAKDSTTNINNGTLTNVVSPATATSGWQTEDQCVSGKCLRFDGTNDYVAMPSDVSALKLTSTVTLQAWVHTGGKSGNNQGIITKWGTNTHQYWLGFVGNSLRMYVSGDGASNIYRGKSNSGILDNNWHHVSAVYTGSSTSIAIYVDGVALTLDESSGTIPGSLFNGTTVVQIGHDVASGDTITFNGSIDDAKIYSYARTAAQVKADYLIGAETIGSSSMTGATKPFLSNGLVGYWKMDEATWSGTLSEVVDASGNANNGQSQGATNGKAYPGAGKFGSGGTFDGVDDYFSVPNTTGSLAPTNITVSSWVKATSNLSSSTIYGIMSSFNGSNGWMLELYNNKIYWVVNTGTGFATANFTAPSSGTWNHFVATQQGAQVNLYANGTLLGTTTMTANVTSVTTDVNVGRRNDGYNIPAVIDDARIYNRALTPAEVSQLYAYAPGPLGYWQFEDSNRTSVTDSSINGNIGTWAGTGAHISPTGKYGKAGTFNASDDRVTVTSTSLPYSFTHEFWFNPTCNLDQKVMFSGTNYQIKFNGGGNGFEVGNSWFTVGAPANYTFTYTPTLNAWQHAAVVFNADNATIYLYKNGVLLGSQAVTKTATPSFGFIGSTAYCGAIDDVKLYNYARSSSQVTEDMQGTGSIFTTTSSGGSSSSSKPNSPLAYWDLDEGTGTTANNRGSSGSTLNGTLTNIASPATSVSGWTPSGKLNKGVIFDGSNDYINIANTSTLSFERTNAFSISIWAKSTSSTGQSLISKIQNSAPYTGWDFYDNQVGTNKLTFWLINTYSSNLIQVSTTNATKIANGSWHHYTATYDGSSSAGGVKIYEDGVSLPVTVNFDSLSATSQNSTAVTIGSRTSGQNPFLGQLDEAKVFNFALTPEQVRQEYNFGSAISYGGASATESASLINGAGSAPVAYWDFEERNGSSVKDSSGNANTGTWNGTLGSQWTTGIYGAGGKFNGTDTYVSVPAITYDLTQHTLSAWVKTTDTRGYRDSDYKVPYNSILSSNVNGGASASFWSLGIVNGQVEGFMDPSTANQNLVGQVFRITSTATINNGQWHHVSWVIDKANLLTSLYIDGRRDTTLSLSGFTSMVDQFSKIGAITYWAGTAYFAGSIDDVKIYNYARTAAQVAYDYNRGAPVGWWDMDECQGTTINDATGNNNRATLSIGGSGTQTTVGTCSTSGSAWGNGATGKYNSGISFDGTDDQITTTNVSMLPTGANPRTISLWVYPTATTTKSILGYGTSASMQMFDVLLYNGIIGVHWYGNGVDSQFPTMRYTLNAWNHVVFTYDGTSLRGYMNGTLKDTTPVALNTVSGGSLLIGNGIYGYNFFGGKIDDVRVYNYALSTTQVKTLYNANSSVLYAPATGSP